MLLLAESQCRQRINQNDEPPRRLTSRPPEAVATVQQDGLRGVLAGFLVDSLISTGRFDDARACVVIYPELSEQLVALGAVAESARTARLGRVGAAVDRQRDSGTISARALPPRHDRRALGDRAESQQGVPPAEPIRRPMSRHSLEAGHERRLGRLAQPETGTSDRRLRRGKKAA